MTVHADHAPPATGERIPQLVIAARVAGVTAIGAAIYQVATPGPPAGAVYETVAGYAREIIFLVYLTASILALLAIQRAHIAGRLGPRLVVAGYSLIAIGVGVGLIVREELEWFFVLGGPGLLLSTIGFLTLAVGIWRRALLPRWAAVLAGVGGAFAILMSEFGTSVLIGSFWLFMATRTSIDVEATGDEPTP